ncbi:MAG: hypothetical protein WDM92_11565 [Caulobacteraceae bacterium]
MAQSDTPAPKAGQVQGEGDYVSGPQVRQGAGRVRQEHRRGRKARREAEEALSDPAQAADIEAAREEAAKGEPRKH